MLTLSVLLAGLIGYLVMAAAFTAAAWKANRRAKWLGLAALALGAPAFVWFGAFAESFDAGLCYSRVIESIAASAEKAESSKDLAKAIRALPMRGYETDCSEVEAAASGIAR